MSSSAGPSSARRPEASDDALNSGAPLSEGESDSLISSTSSSSSAAATAGLVKRRRNDEDDHSAPPPTDSKSLLPHAHGHNVPTAQTLLLVFSLCNLLTYFDRGTIGVCLPTISKEEVFDLNNFEGGVLAGGYMLGYVTASPIFALCVRKYDPFNVMGTGLAIWALGTLCCGFSTGFVTLLLSRATCGIGEAAFLCIAPPFIDKVAPAEHKSRWMAYFYCAIPIGYALGFVIAGQWLNVHIIQVYWQWRFLFWLEFLLMIPFVIFCFSRTTPPHNFADLPPHMVAQKEAGVEDSHDENLSHDNNPNDNSAQHQSHEEQNRAEQSSLLAAGTTVNRPSDLELYRQAVWEVLTNRVYLLIVLGYSAQTFVLGSVAYFGVKYLVNELGFSVGKAGSYFGMFTVIMGVGGSVFGGWLTDHYRGKRDKHHAVAVAMKLATILSWIAFPLCLLSFAKKSAEYFFSFFVVTEFVLFATSSPINSAVIWAVPFRLAPLACSLSIMFIHVLGDAISPAIVGAILDLTNDNWQLTMICTTCWLLWSCIFWFFAWKLAEKKVLIIENVGPLTEESQTHAQESNTDREQAEDILADEKREELLDEEFKEELKEEQQRDNTSSKRPDSSV